MTLGLSRGMNGVTLLIVTLGTIRNATEFQHYIAQRNPGQTGRLGMSGVDTLDVPRTPYRASEGKRSQ